MEKTFLSASIEKLIDIIQKHEILCLFCLVYFIYNLNLRPIGSGDTVPASLLPFCILENHNLYLDQFYYYYAQNSGQVWFLREINGHFMSMYPIVAPVIIIPLYIIPYIYLKLNSCPIDMFHPGFSLTVALMEKLSASLIASLSVIFVYLSLKELIDRRTAAIIAIIFAFATNTWTISSQGLWQHGLVELFLAISIFLILINEKKNSNKIIIYLGVLSGLFLFNRPIDSILLIPIIYYVSGLRDIRIVYYIGAAFLSGAPFLFYNLYYFGSFFGGYSALVGGFRLDPEMISRLVGLLISPSRGLFVYTPIIFLSILGYFNVSQISNKRIKKFLSIFGISIIALTVAYSSFVVWWAGGSFGPRFLTGMLPVAAIYLGLFIKNINFNINSRKNLLVICFVLILLIWSVFSQVVGAFYYPNGNWDGEPNVDQHPEKLWDWKDTQLIRTFNSGMISPANSIKILPRIVTMIQAKDITSGKIILETGWNGIELWNDVSTRWMQANAALTVISSENCTASLKLKALSFHRPRTLEIYVGDNLATRVAVPKDFIEVFVPVRLAKGTNTLQLHVPEGCMRPCDIPEFNSHDCRCLGIAIQDIEIYESISTSFSKGFFGLESWSGVPTQWMDSNATLAIISPDNRSVNLSMRAMSFYRSRTLEIQVGDGKQVECGAIPSTGFTNVTTQIHLARGKNAARLLVQEGCERPCDIPELRNPDSRCLSIAVQNLTVEG